MHINLTCGWSWRNFDIVQMAQDPLPSFILEIFTLQLLGVEVQGSGCNMWTQNNLLWHLYFQSKGCELCTQGCNILTAWLPECNLGEKSPTGDLNITRLPHINAFFSHDLSARVASVVSIRNHLNQIKNSHHLRWQQNTKVTRSGCKNVSIHKSSCLAQLW